MSHIVAELASAQDSIYFLAYSFSADKIAYAMLERTKTGVTLAGVFEKTLVVANKSSSAYDLLLSAGLNVRLTATRTICMIKSS